jgi:hypothetical protein
MSSSSGWWASKLTGNHKAMTDGDALLEGFYANSTGIMSVQNIVRRKAMDGRSSPGKCFATRAMNRIGKKFMVS